MKKNVNLARNTISYLENVIIMYGIYNVEAVQKWVIQFTNHITKLHGLNRLFTFRLYN